METIDGAEAINELTKMLRAAGPVLLRGDEIPPKEEEEEQDEGSGESGDTRLRKPSQPMKNKTLDNFQEQLEKQLKNALYLSRSPTIEQEDDSVQTGSDSAQSVDESVQLDSDSSQKAGESAQCGSDTAQTGNNSAKTGGKPAGWDGDSVQFL